jgi:hypothetical protein
MVCLGRNGLSWKRLGFSDLPDLQWIGIFSSSVGIGRQGDLLWQKPKYRKRQLL